MRIFEMLSENTEYFNEVKNILIFLKMKGIRKVSTQAIANELEKRGIKLDMDTLIDSIAQLPFVSDASSEYVSFKNIVIKDELPDEDIDLDDERVKDMARSAMNRRK